MIPADIVKRVFWARFENFLKRARCVNGPEWYRQWGDTPQAFARNLLVTHYQRLESQSQVIGADRGNSEFWLNLAGGVITFEEWDYPELYGLADLLARKRVDYGCKNITDFGEAGIVIRAMDKVYRIENLSARGGESAVGESLQDALQDIVGYAGVAYLYLTQQWMDETISTGE